MVIGVRHFRIIGQCFYVLSQKSRCRRDDEQAHTHAYIQPKPVIFLFQPSAAIQTQIRRNQKQTHEPAVVITITVRNERDRKKRFPNRKEKQQQHDNFLQCLLLQFPDARRQKRREQI